MAGRRVVLWRHGQTEWNVTDRFQGSTDVPLDAVGVAQAERAARLLAALSPAAIVSSDLSRASTTAAALGAVSGMTVALDERLRETYGGSWQGRTAAELTAEESAAYREWRSGANVPAGEGGERRTELAARVVAAITDAVSTVAAGETLVVVTHGGSARAAIGTMLGLPLELWPVVGGLANCSWSVLEEASIQGRPGWRLVEHNAGSLPEPVMSDEE